MDADEHAHDLTNWEQSYDQITPGRFHGALAELQLPQMQVNAASLALCLRMLSALLAPAGECTNPVSCQQELTHLLLTMLDASAVDGPVSESPT